MKPRGNIIFCLQLFQLRFQNSLCILIGISVNLPLHGLYAIKIKGELLL